MYRQVPPQQQPGPAAPQQPYAPPPGSYVPQSYPESTPAAPGAPAPYAPQQPYMSGPTYGAPETPTAPPKKRSYTGLIVGGIALVLLIVAGAVGFTFINRLANPPSVAVEKLLPANTLAYLTIDPTLEGSQKAALDKIGEAFESQPGFKEAWAKMTSGIMESTGQTSESGTPESTGFDTISEYLGDNVTIAVLPPSTADLEQLRQSFMGEGTGNPEEIMMRNVAGVLDLDFNPLNKKGPISDLKKTVDNLSSAKLAEKYRDMDIYEYVTDTTTLYFSLLGGTSTVVVGGKTDPLHVLIDQYKDKKGLSEEARFKTLSAQVPSERIATLYVNLTEIYKDIAFAEPELARQTVAGADGALLVAVSAQDDGMQIDLASEATVEGAGVKMNPNARPDLKIVSDVPQNALGILAGTDLKSAIQSFLDVARKQGQASGEDMVTQTLDDFEQATGLSLEKDVLPWMGGDYALSVSADTTSGEPMPSVVFQMKLSDADRQKAINTIQKLVNSPDAGQIESVDTPEGTFYNLVPDTGMLLGVANDRLLVVYETDLVAAKLRIGSVMGDRGKGLGASTQWQSVSKHLPKSSNAVVYVDIEGARKMAEGLMDEYGKQEYETSAAPFIRPIKYLVVGSEPLPGSDGSLTRSHTIIFLNISK